MRALLLAAGLGTRLKTLTTYIPKCLSPISNRPLIDYWLDTLLKGGISEVLVNTHYMADIVEHYIKQSSWRRSVSLVFEKELLGTAGTILKNRHFFEQKPFLVAHADNLTLFDLQDFQQKHFSRPKGTSLTMMTFEAENPELCGVVEIDQNRIVQKFHEKIQNPPDNLSNAAVYIFEPTVIDFIAEFQQEFIDLSTDIIPKYLGKIFTYHNGKYHRDIGTLQSWRAANLDFPMPKASQENASVWESMGENHGELHRNITSFLS